MTSTYTGYQGFTPNAYRRTETEKIASTQDQRDKKFRQNGAKVLETTAGFQTTTANSQSNVKREHYVAALARPLNPLKAKDRKGFSTKEFVHSSSYSSTFPNFVQQLLDLEGPSEQEYRAAFKKVDADNSGTICAKEVSLLIRHCTGKVPNPRVVDTFMVFFDRNGDGKISWDEFVDALGRVEAHMKRELSSKKDGTLFGKDPPRSNKVLPTPLPKTSNQTDLGCAGEDPRSRSKATGSDLSQGTTKVTNHIAGYSGHISTYTPNIGENVRENSVPNKFQTKYIFQQYMNPPGYSGIKNSNPQGMGNLSTDKSRIDRLVEDMWRERNAGKGSVLSETTQMLKPFVPNFEDQ